MSLLAAGLAVSMIFAQDLAATRKLPAQKVTSLSGAPSKVEWTGRTTAVIFISTRCPISNGYNERLKTLYERYGERVRFLVVNANANEPVEEVAQHASEAEYPFPVWKGSDPLIEALDASWTPESFVVDAAGVVRYRGAIDDARNPARVTRNYLSDALDAVLSGKAVPVPETRSFGCTIKKEKREP